MIADILIHLRGVTRPKGLLPSTAQNPELCTSAQGVPHFPADHLHIDIGGSEGQEWFQFVLRLLSFLGLYYFISICSSQLMSLLTLGLAPDAGTAD